MTEVPNDCAIADSEPWRTGGVYCLQPREFVDKYVVADFNVADVDKTKRRYDIGPKSYAIEIAAIIEAGFDRPVQIADRFKFLGQWVR